MTKIAKPKSPNPTDQYVGSRLRMQRTTMGMSQVKLAKALRISWQQVQKYEKGTNRISASRLQRIAQILAVPMGFFFDGAPFAMIATGMDNLEGLQQSQYLSFVKAFMRIKNDDMRRLIINLIMQLADDDESG